MRLVHNPHEVAECDPKVKTKQSMQPSSNAYPGPGCRVAAV